MPLQAQVFLLKHFEEMVFEIVISDCKTWMQAANTLKKSNFNNQLYNKI